MPASPKQSKYIEWRKSWRARSIGEDLVETKAFLPKDAHSRLVDLASQLGERIPVVIGNCLVSYLATSVKPVRGAQMVNTPTAPSSRVNLPMSGLLVLVRAIGDSRFKGDTGASRSRQIGYVAMLAEEIASGHRPTAATMARLLGSRASQLELLGKLLEARGVVQRTHMANIAGAPSGKILSISDEAVEKLNQAHIDQVGWPLLKT